jgi:hypothetical protein
MITKTIAAGLIAITTLTAVPASAASFNFSFGQGPSGYYGQGNHGGHGGRSHDRRHDRVSADEVRWMLRRDGYRGIRFFDDRGAVYQLRAEKHGREFFLVVSARTGEILSRQRI